MSFMDGDCITSWPMNFSPCLFLHINSNYLGELHHVHKTINKHTFPIYGYYNTLVLFRFFKDPSSSFR
jgi:hypothetical protein